MSWGCTASFCLEATLAVLIPCILLRRSPTSLPCFRGLLLPLWRPLFTRRSRTRVSGCAVMDKFPCLCFLIIWSFLSLAFSTPWLIPGFLSGSRRRASGRAATSTRCAGTAAATLQRAAVKFKQGLMDARLPFVLRLP